MTVNERKYGRLATIVNIYGELPQKPIHLSAEITSEEPDFAAGKAILREQRLMIETENGEVAIPFLSAVATEKRLPVILYLGFDGRIPNKYLPAEEVLDRGYSLFSLDLSRVSDINQDFKSGVAGKIARSRKKKNATGKIMLWTWSAIRMIEYISSLEYVDKDKIIVAGHGFAAICSMLCAVVQAEVKYAIANDPYAPIGKGYQAMACEMPYLFSPEYATMPNVCPIDRTIDLLCGKGLLLGSAKDKPFSNREGELAAISRLDKDNSSYHQRGGTEYFSREDWNIYLDFLDKKLK